jgi:hypothetical protein
MSSLPIDNLRNVRSGLPDPAVTASQWPKAQRTARGWPAAPTVAAMGEMVAALASDCPLKPALVPDEDAEASSLQLFEITGRVNVLGPVVDKSRDAAEQQPIGCRR